MDTSKQERNRSNLYSQHIVVVIVIVEVIRKLTSTTVGLVRNFLAELFEQT